MFSEYIADGQEIIKTSIGAKESLLLMIYTLLASSEMIFLFWKTIYIKVERSSSLQFIYLARPNAYCHLQLPLLETNHVS